MASIISAGTTSGTSLNLSGDTSGVLQLASNGSTTAVTIDTNQRAAFVAGTAALPAITTTGDTNTGIFFPAADTIAFSEGGAEAARFDASGRLLIGTTSGTRKLTVYENAAQVDISIVSSTTGVAILQMGDTAADNQGQIIYRNNGDSMEFGVNGAERMRIDSNGALLVGTTTVYNTATTNVGFVGNVGSGISVNTTTATNGATFQVFLSTGTLIGSISNNNNTGVSYNTTSDYRLKENIAPMTGALAVVQQLKPVTYTWKLTGEASQGFIAHELQAIVPDCVTGEKDAVDEEGNPVHQGIDTSFLVATLTAAIQELKAELDATKAEVQALKGTL